MSTLKVNTINNLSSTGSANQVFYRNGSNVVSGSSNLTFDGTTLTAPTFNGNATTATTATTASSCSGIVYNQNTNSNSITLTLPSGTWVVEFFFTAELASYITSNVIIDGVTIYTLPATGDPAGTAHRPSFAIATVTGGRTITCSCASDSYQLSTRRCVVKGTRIA